MYGRRTHLKVSLHVGLGGRPAVDLAEVVDKCEILPLFVCEGFCGHRGSVSASGAHQKGRKRASQSDDLPVKTGHTQLPRSTNVGSAITGHGATGGNRRKGPAAVPLVLCANHSGLRPTRLAHRTRQKRRVLNNSYRSGKMDTRCKPRFRTELYGFLAWDLLLSSMRLMSYK